MYYNIDTPITVLIFLLIFISYINKYLTKKQELIKIVKVLTLFLICSMISIMLTVFFDNNLVTNLIYSFFTYNIYSIWFMFTYSYVGKKKITSKNIYMFFIVSATALLALLYTAITGIYTEDLAVMLKIITNVINIISITIYIYTQRKHLSTFEAMLLTSVINLPFLVYLIFNILKINNHLPILLMSVELIMVYLIFQDRLIEVDIRTKTCNRKNLEIYLDRIHKSNKEDLTIIFMTLPNLYDIENKFGEGEKDYYLGQFSKVVNETITDNEKFAYNGRNEFILYSNIVEEEKIFRLLNEISKNVNKYNVENNNKFNMRYVYGIKTIRKGKYITAFKEAYNDMYENLLKKERTL